MDKSKQQDLGLGTNQRLEMAEILVTWGSACEIAWFATFTFAGGVLPKFPEGALLARSCRRYEADKAHRSRIGPRGIPT